MERILIDGFRRAQAGGQTVWAGDSIDIGPVDPVATFAQCETAGGLYMPAEGMTTVGLGVAREWQWNRSGAWHWMEAVWRRLSQSGLPRSVKLFGGQAFPEQRPSPAEWAGFPNMSFVVPAVQVEQPPDPRSPARLAVTVELAPDSDLDRILVAYRQFLSHIVGHGEALAEQASPRLQTVTCVPDRTGWNRMVKAALSAIADGDIEKVVVARSLRLTADRAWPLALILQHLRTANPDTTVFALRRGRSTFLGATPEQLVAVAGRTVQTMCLAGSSNRGLTPEEDSRLAEALLIHPKNLEEHRIVCRHVTQTLGPLCSQIASTPAPRLRKLPTVQHLCTAVSGTLLPSTTIWTAAQALHPTPAVAGLPVESAQSWLETHEPFSRGWYAGSIGQVDLTGNGSFVVGLRSAVLHESRAVVYAGCGIVQGSVPDQEYDESRWKFRPVLEALGADGAEW